MGRRGRKAKQMDIEEILPVSKEAEPEVKKTQKEFIAVAKAKVEEQKIQEKPVSKNLVEVIKTVGDKEHRMLVEETQVESLLKDKRFRRK